MSTPTHCSPSYRPCSCGANCPHGSPDEPCWGPVNAVDEVSFVDEEGNPDWYWIHVCEGHSDKIDGYDGSPYIPEPRA